MPFSLAKLFKKDDAKTKDQKPTEQDSSSATQTSGGTSSGKKKHGEPGSCCGSCS